MGSNDIAQPNWNPDEWFDYMSYCPKHRDGEAFTKLDNWLSATGWGDEFKALAITPEPVLSWKVAKYRTGVGTAPMSTTSMPASRRPSISAWLSIGPE